MKRNVNLSLIQRMELRRFAGPNRTKGLFLVEGTEKQVRACVVNTGKNQVKTNSGVKGVELGARPKLVCAMKIRLPVILIAAKMVSGAGDNKLASKGETEISRF